jgi:zinc transport system ATP-binding protein
VTATVIEASGVAFSYGRRPVLDGVDLRVGRGEFVALVGSNGSGKSTLLRVLLGLAKAERGEVRLMGEPPDRLADRWRIGYVPQRPSTAELLPATVEEVAAAGRLGRRGWWRRPGAGDRAGVEAALAAVDLLPRRADRLGELSGGQQQRAFIAKALASRPEVLVLDEPTAGVDVDSQRRFRDALVGLVDGGAAVLLVSHELGAVAADLHRVVVLRHGKVAFDGPPADLEAAGVSLGVHGYDLPVWLERDA